jgi:hypothetical protein
MSQVPVRLSQSEVPVVLSIVFKLTDYLNQLWNLFMVFSAIVVGWRFSAGEHWQWNQKLLATLLYTGFLFVNGLALRSTYKWLDFALEDLRTAAATIDEQAPQIKSGMGYVSIPGGHRIPLFIYVVGAVAVIVSIWLDYQ